jgi:hypothetical protein
VVEAGGFRARTPTTTTEELEMASGLEAAAAVVGGSGGRG